MLIALYRTGFRTKRWYMCIFSQLLDVCVNNAWRLKQRESVLLGEASNQKLKEFRASVADGLLRSNRALEPRRSSNARVINAPSLPRPQHDIRYDGIEHFPEACPRGRCKNCRSGTTRIRCRKCQMQLCLFPERNCFFDFHHKI